MNKFSKIVTTANAVNNVSEVEKQINDVKNSKLSDEEKSKALISHKKMVKTTIIVVLLTIIVVVISSILICNFFTDELRIIMCLVSAVIGTIFLISFAILKNKFFPDWAKYYNKVDLGYDGLSEIEISKLSPTTGEEQLIKKYKKKSLVYGIIFIITLAIEFSIVLGIGLPIYSPITIIITLIITIIWYINNDNCKVEIHRIKSGYYKKNLPKSDGRQK